HSTTDTVQPGQTTTVTHGDSGAVIQCRVRLETPPTNGEKLNISGNLSTFTGAVPSFNSPAESQAFFSSPEYRARINERKYFAVAVNADGSFMVDSVPPGSYSLTL